MPSRKSMQGGESIVARLFYAKHLFLFYHKLDIGLCALIDYETEKNTVMTTCSFVSVFQNDETETEIINENKNRRKHIFFTV